MKKLKTLFSLKGASTMPRARARYLHQAIQLEEKGPVRITSLAIYFTITLLIAVIVWASVTEINEVAVTRGKIMPAGSIHSVQHLEGGIVNEIMVHNGDQVKKGDILLRLSPPATQSELGQTEVRRVSLQLSAERLQAILEGRTLDFKETGIKYPQLATRQRKFYKAQIQGHLSELSVLNANIKKRKLELKRQQNEVISIDGELAVLKQQFKMREKLYNKNLFPKAELLETKLEVTTLESKKQTAVDGVGVIREAINEARQQLQGVLATFTRNIEDEASKISSELAQLDQSMVRLQDRVKRLSVTAPVSGIVQGLELTSISAIIKPGEVIMNIIPTNDEMIIETRVPPAEIGYVHSGQTAEIKLDSYDPARFGTVQGSVRRISAYTYLDEENNPYYRAEIELEKDHVGDQPGRNRVMPGMLAQADIRTGSKTLLDYLIRPVSRGFNSAFRER